MKHQLKKKIALLFLISFGLFITGIDRTVAQDSSDTTEAGISEHLGTLIPLDLTFRNELNGPVSLREIIHKPTLLVLIYFDCPGICPMILTSVSKVVGKMNLELGKDFQVVTVSFNHNDTPEKALDKKKQFYHDPGGKHPENWYFLTGDSLSIQKLSKALGYRFIQTGNDFIHPACIMVLSPEGKVTRYLYGTDFLPFDVKMALIEAQRGLTRPTINRVLDFCYAYDPAGRRYSLEITKVSGVIILFLALAFFAGLLIKTKIKKNRPNDNRI